MIRTCELCGNEFESKAPSARFCSRKCQTSKGRMHVAPAAVETRVEIDRVHPADDNVRHELTDIEGLAASIVEVGILQPLLLQRHPLPLRLRPLLRHPRLRSTRAIRPGCSLRPRWSR